MVRVVHPFHPRCGEMLAVVAVRQNWGEERVYYHDAEGRLRSIPAAWTDVVAADPFVILSAGHSAFRLTDLVEVVRLVASWGEEDER